MNRKMVIYTVARIIKIEAFFFLLPAIVSFLYKENKLALIYFVVSILTFGLSSLIIAALKPKNKIIYAKEGFAIVGIAWMLLSAIGALPFVISGEIPSFIDAFFETVSGFTTTGSSILTDVEAMSYGNLFWRSFTHWIGGMGFLVFVIAITNNISDRSIHILRAEVPGPVVGKLVPKATQTAKILYLIYIAMTLVEIVMLYAGDMSLFESIVHSLGTAGTGGFGIKGDSVASYSPYCQWVIAVFMMLFGINFNVYYLLIIGRLRSAFKSTEMWCYLLIMGISTSVITLNIYSKIPSIGDAVRHSFFQVSAIMTTTGFVTTDFNLWPNLSKTIILVLMLIGACAGSTGGGFKISRFVLLMKVMGRQLKKMIHPKLVRSIHFEGKTVDEETVSGVTSYLAFYIFCLLSVFLVLAFEPKMTITSNLSAAFSCFNNIGPGLDQIGPFSNFAAYSDFSTVVLSFAMLFGRLEILPMLICFSPSTWTKK